MLAACGSSQSQFTLELPSVDRSLTAYITPDPPHIPVNDFFELRIELVDGSGRPIMPGQVSLAVDAVMPTHHHGMMHEPTLTIDGNGWHVQDMLLHMPGLWVLSVDAEHPDGSRTRMQRNLEIE